MRMCQRAARTAAGKSQPEEIAQPLDRADARPVDHQEGAQRKVLEIEQKVAVERDGARNRQRGQRRAVKDRQPLQLVQRERADAAPLEPPHQPFKLAPASSRPLRNSLLLRTSRVPAGGSRRAATAVICGGDDRRHISPRCLIMR